MNEIELLQEAERQGGLSITSKDKDIEKILDMQSQRLIRLEEYNTPVYVYRITKKGKEYLREKVMA